MKAVAHTPREPGGEWHDLAAHLSATANEASTRAVKFGAGDLAYLAGLLHDYGKYNPDFQQYLQDAHAGREAARTPHAVFGAMLAAERGIPELGQIIAGHHGQMPSRGSLDNDFKDPAIRDTYERIKVAAADSGWGLKLSKEHGSGGRGTLEGHALEMLLRMVFSTLVDSDYLDTERHFDPDRSTQRTEGVRPGDLLPMLLTDQERIMARKGGLSTMCVERSTSIRYRRPRGVRESTGWSLRPGRARHDQPSPSGWGMPWSIARSG
jgi:CRISPR-associated endonuclease/helicase Cas3